MVVTALGGGVRADEISPPGGAPADLSRDPEARGFAQLFFAQGRVLLADRAYAEALPLFEKAAATEPSDLTFRYFAGLCQLRLGHFDEAVVSLERTLPPAACRVPEARIRLDLGEAAFRLGDLARAERELRVAVRLDERNAWAHLYLGLTLFAHLDEKAALAEFKQAAEIDPGIDLAASYARGIEAYTSGDATEGRRALQAALGSAPDGPSPESLAWIDALERKTGGGRLPRLELRAGVSFEYDDNPGRISDQVNVPGNQSDERGVLSLRAAYTPDQAGAWRPGFVLNGYASRHGRFRAADMDGIQILFQATYGKDRLGYFIGPLGYARVPEGDSPFGFLFQGGTTYFNRNVSSFRRDHDAAASLFLREPRLGKTQVDAQYTDRTYFDPDPDIFNRTGQIRTFRAVQYFDLRGPEPYLRLALSHSDSSARTSALAYSTDRALGEIVLPFAKRWTVYGFASLARDGYRKASVSRFGRVRTDERSEAGGTLTFTVNRHLYVTARYRWTHSRVRPDDFSYERNSASAGVTYYR